MYVLIYMTQQAPPPDDDAGLVEPGHVLKYSAYKNLASLAEKREQWEKSIDAYLQVNMNSLLRQNNSARAPYHFQAPYSLPSHKTKVLAKYKIYHHFQMCKI